MRSRNDGRQESSDAPVLRDDATSRTVLRMHDDEIDPDDDLAELIADDDLGDDEAEMSEHDVNAHTLSIRRADGTEVVSVVAALGSGPPWSVYMQPGGDIQNAYIGTPDVPLVWVNTDEHSVSRDDDGTYVISID